MKRRCEGQAMPAAITPGGETERAFRCDMDGLRGASFNGFRQPLSGE